MAHDVIVLGLGAVGAAAAYQLAKRGARVLGIDRHAPPHRMGSSHGGSRITRLAIGEGAHYTPLVLRAHEIWREIEDATGADLLCCNGGLIVSSRATNAVTHVPGFFDNTVAAARKFGIAHELLDASEIRRRFPNFAVADEEFGYFEPSAGFLRPELCVHAQLQLAQRHGAVLRLDERAIAIRPEAGAVAVTTDKQRYEAHRLIVAAGAWTGDLLGAPFSRWLKVYRQVQCWFALDADVADFRPDRFPVFIWELPAGRRGVYGFPAIDGATGGVKLASESFERPITLDEPWRTVAEDEPADMHRNCVAPYVRGVASRCVKAAACLYTVTPDFGFLIASHPDDSRITVASPCSGHGFKHSAAIGEALAQMTLEGGARLDLSAFGPERFSDR